MAARSIVPSTRGARAGFTLIELMVVIAIIVLAAGLMTPTITDFFKNRQLEGIKGQFGSAFNTARMSAVNQGRSVSVVFFREGVRVYDEKYKTFLDEFNPETAPAADEKVWFELGFLNRKPSTALKRYRDWESTQKEAAEAAVDDRRGSAGKKPASPTFNVNGLPRVTYSRDGTLNFMTGNDVLTSEYNKPIPENADIMIFQSGNAVTCFIDLRSTGQMRNKTVATKETHTKPAATGDGDDVDAAPSAPAGLEERGEK